MMNYAILAVLFLIVTILSPVNTTIRDTTLDYQKHLESKNLTQTKNVLARVVARPQKKFLIANNIIEDDDDDNPPGPDELELFVAYARPTVVNREQDFVDDDDIELSPYIIKRLAQARAKALTAYRQKYLETA